MFTLGDQFLDPALLYHFMSATRAGTSPDAPPDVDQKNPNIYLTLGGTRAAPTFTMTENSFTDRGTIWYIRDAGSSGDDQFWTIHNGRMGNQLCLERADTTAGTLMLAPVIQSKESQRWCFVYEGVPDTSQQYMWKIQEKPPSTSGLMGAPSPARLDILDRGDQVVAKTIVGNPIDPDTNRPYLELTTWAVAPKRKMSDREADTGIVFG